MRVRIATGASLAVALLLGGVLLADGLKSGPQVGSSKITPFNPLHCNLKGEGGKACLV